MATYSINIKYTKRDKSLDNADLIAIILNNIFKSLKRHIINVDKIIDPKEKLFLWEHMIISNNIYI